MNDRSASEQIDSIIEANNGWKGDLLKKLREVIRHADADVMEEIKWKMRTRPEGLAVWSHDGILCFVEIWKDNTKLLFPHGAQLKDPKKLFNSRLQSKDIRAIEFKDGSLVDEAALSELVTEAVKLNESKTR